MSPHVYLHSCCLLLSAYLINGSSQQDVTDTYLRPTPAIIGGIQAQAHAYPWLVSVQRHKNHACGGTLITSRIVVTAAHCLYDMKEKRLLGDDELSVLAGIHFLTSFKKHNRIGVSYVAPHPDYQVDDPDQHYDLGFLILETPVDAIPRLDKKVSFDIELPPNQQNFWPNSNSYIFATGWGHVNQTNTTPAPTGDNRKASPTVQVANMTVLAYKECRQRWSESPSVVTSSVICTDSTSTDICQGDSGGPLVEVYMDPKTKQPRKRLIGIVSLTYVGCGVVNRSSIFTRVNRFVPFINQAKLEIQEMDIVAQAAGVDESLL